MKNYITGVKITNKLRIQNKFRIIKKNSWDQTLYINWNSRVVKAWIERDAEKETIWEDEKSSG